MSERKLRMNPVLGMPYNQGKTKWLNSEDIYKQLAEAILDPMTYEKLRLEMTTSELEDQVVMVDTKKQESV